MATQHATSRSRPELSAHCLALALTACVFALAHGPWLIAPYVINDDARQQLFWMQRWLDPALYPTPDLLTEFAVHYVSYGVRGLYRALAWLGGEPLEAGKWVAGALYVLMGWGVFALGAAVGQSVGPGADSRRDSVAMGVGALVVFLLHPYFLHNISGGLARAFAGPALVWFAWAWVADRGRLAGGILLAAALFIPYIFALCAGACVVAVLARRIRPGWIAPPHGLRRGWLATVLLLGGGASFLFSHALTAAGFGPMADAEAIAGRPEFTAEGRLAILPTPSLLKLAVLDPLERLFPFIDWDPVRGGLVAVAAGLLLLAASRRFPWRRWGVSAKPLLAVVAASVGLYMLARLMLLTLFLPSRYVEYGAHLGWCLLLGAPLGWWLARRLPRWAAGALLVGVALTAGARLDGQGLYHYGEHAALYAQVRQTPPAAMLAGHPYLMDNVLTFGQRRVLASFELAHPWCVGLWAQLAPRLAANLQAYYSDDPDAILRFCEMYGVDFLVVDARHFTPSFLHPATEKAPFWLVWGWPESLGEPVAGLLAKLGAPITIPAPPPRDDTYPARRPFFAPFDAVIRKVITAGEGRFALLDETRFPGVRVNEHQRLVDVRPLLNAFNQAGAAPSPSSLSANGSPHVSSP